eukprot:1372421-Amphidinium_carterae.2
MSHQVKGSLKAPWTFPTIWAVVAAMRVFIRAGWALGSALLQCEAAASFKLAPEVAEDAFDVDMSLDEACGGYSNTR